MDKVSLYIPCFNAAETIKECLDNVLNQDYPIDEILIIDDGCRDRTVELISGYPLRVIRHPENRGLAAARNTAFKEARNDFVAALDADCAPRRDWLRQLMDCFSSEDIAGAGGILIDRYADGAADKWRSSHMPQTWGGEVLENPPFLYGSNSIFKKAAVLSVGMYNEIFGNNYEDVGLSVLLYSRGFRLIYNPRGAVEHLRRDTLLSVLNSYWHWQHSRDMKVTAANKIYYGLAARLDNSLDLFDDISHFLRQDWRERNYQSILIDSMALFYCPWLGIKYCFRYILSRVIKIWK